MEKYSVSASAPTTAVVELDDAFEPIVVGHADENLRLLESLLAADIHLRGGVVTIKGKPTDVSLAVRAFKELESMARRGHDLSPESVRHAVGIVGRGEKSASEMLGGSIVTHRGKTVRPKTEGQKLYVDAIDRHSVVFGIGPAGTGKTFLAMAKAVAALKAKQVERIILTRPAVEAGENLGFLPGTLSEKIDPYLRPLHDAMREMIEPELIVKLMETGVVEVAPLAYMRGRTLNNSFIILDEAQNTTPARMKMFLTRLGFGSKMVITGDASQVDLPRGQRSGLAAAREVLRGVQGIAFPTLGSADVVRNPLVTAIVEAYDDFDAYSAGIEQGAAAGQSGQSGQSKQSRKARVSWN